MIQLQVYAAKIESAHAKYHDVLRKLLPLIPEGKQEDHDQHYYNFDEQHTEVSNMLQTLINEQTKVQQQSSSELVPQREQPPMIVHQPLPRPIPTFDGRQENWLQFKIIFKDIVDKAPDPPAVKLYHLTKGLVGAAAGLIDA